MFFYGKPITSFTNYQMAIYTRAMRNTFVLREAKGTPPQINSICTVQEILDWYDSQYAIIISGNDPSTHGQVKERQGKGGIRRSIKM
jgi:hypothetical protein